MLINTKFVLLSNQQICACNLTFAIYANMVIFDEFPTVILIFIRPFLKLSHYRFNPKDEQIICYRLQTVVRSKNYSKPRKGSTPTGIKRNTDFSLTEKRFSLTPRDEYCGRESTKIKMLYM